MQDLLDRARALIEARAIELREIPGGETGLLCRDLKGRNADQAAYKADVALIAEIRASCAKRPRSWAGRSKNVRTAAASVSLSSG